MVRVKICGITNHRDASLAVTLGADLLGFIFASSPRQITPSQAREIINALPPFVHKVGVFVDEDVTEMRRIAEFCGLDFLQLHGDEPPHICSRLMPCTIKAFRLKNESSLSSIRAYQGNVRAVLLDTYQEEVRGGTGKTFDWKLAAGVEDLNVPVILAGGLGPANIIEAVSTVKPYAVDVNSGIEESPGKKNPQLMRELMNNIRKMNL